MEITINLEQACSELASGRVLEASAYKQYDEIYEYDAENDVEIFNDKFQHIHDIWYDYYLNKLKSIS